MTWLELDETASTQDEALLRLTEPDGPDVVFASHQTSGRGRFGRIWHSNRGESLTMSLILRTAADHPRPWLCGMIAAIEAARLLDCRVRWPNDLTLDGRKLGGILTDVKPDQNGRMIPVLGIGVNLKQTSFAPELADKATSLAAKGARIWEAVELGRVIASRVLRETWPTEWVALKSDWDAFDDTPGKVYVTATGEHLTATGLGDQGELLGKSEGRTVSVMAAEAVFGLQEA